MINLLIAIIISVVLLWFFGKNNLGVLGLYPLKNRLLQLIGGFVVAAICCTIYFLSLTSLGKASWTFNADIQWKTLVVSCWIVFQAVLMEELIFRGALLYLAIRKFGENPACILSSIIFAIYHWFLFGVWGNPLQMMVVFIMMSIWGLMFAMSFAKTKSMYLPIGLHLGWNFFNSIVLSQGPLGHQLFYSSERQILARMVVAVFYLFQVFALPLATFWYLRRKKK